MKAARISSGLQVISQSDSHAANLPKVPGGRSEQRLTKATSSEQNLSVVSLDKEMMTFDYGLPAELFMAKRKGGARSRLISRRFAMAAEAIRFAVEDFPAIRSLGAWMQVGNERFDGEDIHRLYESRLFPLRRRMG
jgi:hypothetical protein